MPAFTSTLAESEATDGSAAPATRQPWHRPQVAELPPDEAAEAHHRVANLDAAFELAVAGLPVSPAVVEQRGDGVAAHITDRVRKGKAGAGIKALMN
jgi:hypothetical protein